MKCVGAVYAPKNVYDGKTVRFQSAQSRASQVATDQASTQKQHVVAAQP